jgi:hypothetical protein
LCRHQQAIASNYRPKPLLERPLLTLASSEQHLNILSHHDRFHKDTELSRRVTFFHAQIGACTASPGSKFPLCNISSQSNRHTRHASHPPYLPPWSPGRRSRVEVLREALAMALVAVQELVLIAMAM